MLVVGILIGVGISGRGFVSDAERTRLNEQIADLREQVDAANATSTTSGAGRRLREDFVDEAYPALVESRLDGKRIAVLVLGSVDHERVAVRRARDRRTPAARLAPDARRSTLPLRRRGGRGGAERAARAQRLRRRRAAREPRPRSRRESSSPAGRRRSGMRSAGEIVEEREAASATRSTASSSSARPSRSRARRARSSRASTRASRSTGVPAVGVEPTRVEQSAIPAFQRDGLSTVDGDRHRARAGSRSCSCWQAPSRATTASATRRRRDPAADRSRCRAPSG